MTQENHRNNLDITQMILSAIIGLLLTACFCTDAFKYDPWTEEFPSYLRTREIEFNEWCDAAGIEFLSDDYCNKHNKMVDDAEADFAEILKQQKNNSDEESN